MASKCFVFISCNFLIKKKKERKKVDYLFFESYIKTLIMHSSFIFSNAFQMFRFYCFTLVSDPDFLYYLIACICLTKIARMCWTLLADKLNEIVLVELDELVL